MHGRSYIQSKQEQKLRNDAFIKHQNALGRVMSHERESNLQNNYKKGNLNHWQVGASKQRAFIHKQAEREIDIERDNLKLLQKLEEIKRKGQQTNQRSPELRYVKNAQDIIAEKHRQADAQRYTKARVLQTANVKMSKHIKNAPSSISARKLEHDFMRNSSYIKMQEKTDGGRRDIVNGGFKSSPRANRFRDNIKLPPLSYKPLIKDDTNHGTMTTFHQISEMNDKSTLASAHRGSPLQEESFDDFNRNSANILAKSRPKKLSKPRLVSMQMDLLHSRGFPSTTKSMGSVGPSEFASHFGKVQEMDDIVKKARETSLWLQKQTNSAETAPIDDQPRPVQKQIKSQSVRKSKNKLRGPSKHSVNSRRSGVDLDDVQHPPETAEDFMNKTGQSFAIAPQNSEIRQSNHREKPGMKMSPMSKNKSPSLNDGSFRSRGSSHMSKGNISQKSRNSSKVGQSVEQLPAPTVPQETVQETNNDQEEPGRPNIVFTTEAQPRAETNENIPELQSNGSPERQAVNIEDEEEPKE